MDEQKIAIELRSTDGTGSGGGRCIAGGKEWRAAGGGNIERTANPKVLRHQTLCLELNKLYAKKNADYGDSFHLSFVEEGFAMARIRLSDKLNRFKQLSKNPEGQQVNDESMRDTLIDLANYALMTVLELEEAASKSAPGSD